MIYEILYNEISNISKRSIGDNGHGLGNDMTKLDKPIYREVAFPEINRTLIIGLVSETKKITFREKGCHSEKSLPILSAWLDAIRLENGAGKKKGA